MLLIAYGYGMCQLLTLKKDHEGIIVQRVKDRVGSVKVVMEPMVEIPRGPNGKFRAVISRLSKAKAADESSQ